MKSIKII